ncbi:uncharacterized protein BJX67DRAFT_42264 [Aspergillus lucknowensis]|uniref:RanBP2-type domain-containing protein n=1 Tax=Aspergillus lucknowensis TaxID=176173 RepID=A0ABR4LVD2_9EURO
MCHHSTKQPNFTQKTSSITPPLQARPDMDGWWYCCHCKHMNNPELTVGHCFNCAHPRCGSCPDGATYGF